FLASTNAHGDVVLPAGLAGSARGIGPTGCAVLTWQAQPVSMLCFGKNGKTDLWLFVVDRQALPDGPEDSVPHCELVNSRMTASWTKGGRIYFLVGDEGQAALKQYF